MNCMVKQFLACTLILGLNAPAFAQLNEEDQHRPNEAAETAKMAVDASASSAETQTESNRITWEQVYKNPDNIELNYKYAQQQVAEGDVRGAVATLERILIIDPGLPRVRLFYAVVLYRLGSYAESRRELLQLKDLQMPGSLRAEIDEYLRRIQRKLRRTNISARFSIGVQYDTNRNASPGSGQRLFGGTPVTLTTGLKEGDQALIGMANIAVVHDLGSQGGHTFDADYNYYRAEQAELDLLDFDAHSWSLGGTYKTARYGEFSPKSVFQFYQLDNTDYMRGRGVQFGWKKTVTTKWALDAGLRTVFEEFLDRTIVNAPERTGQRTQWWYGAQYAAKPQHRLGFRHTIVDKDARELYNAYLRHSLMGNHQWLLGKGRFMLTTLTINSDQYEAPETIIANQHRRDTSARINLTYGMPLGGLQSMLRDLIWTVGYDYYKNSSNITNYDFTNHKFNMMFTYKWDH
jgi:tetratricopeptide (TPR) repeat protein